MVSCFLSFRNYDPGMSWDSDVQDIELHSPDVFNKIRDSEKEMLKQRNNQRISQILALIQLEMRNEDILKKKEQI